jgi:hypothetical protein
MTAWFGIEVATQNTQGRRLSPKKPANIGDWHKGAAFSSRVTYMANLLVGHSPDVIVTQEQGDMTMARLQAAAYTAKLPGTYAVAILGGDKWDISQAIIYRTDVLTVRETGEFTLTPSGPGHSHNRVPWAIFDQIGSALTVAIVAPHLISGHTTTNAKDRGKQAVDLAGQIEDADWGVPAMVIGDVNQTLATGDPVGSAFAKHGYVDAERTPCPVVNPTYDSSNQLENPPVRHSSQIDRAFAIPKQIKFTLRQIVLALTARRYHRTPWPADHQPVLFRALVAGV